MLRVVRRSRPLLRWKSRSAILWVVIELLLLELRIHAGLALMMLCGHAILIWTTLLVISRIVYRILMRVISL